MIKIICQSTLPLKYEKNILKYSKYLLHSLKINKGLNIIITDNEQMRKLHKKYCKDDSPTDVLSFHSYGIDNFLGEVIVNIDFAKKESKKRKISLEEEVYRYITHGVLHILGYRDDKRNLKKIMWQKQEELLRKYLNE